MAEAWNEGKAELELFETGMSREQASSELKTFMTELGVNVMQGDFEDVCSSNKWKQLTSAIGGYSVVAGLPDMNLMIWVDNGERRVQDDCLPYEFG